MASYAERLKFWRNEFSQARIPTAGLDARLLLQFVSHLDAAGLICCDQNEIMPSVSCNYDRVCRRRIAGEPVARITGEKEFYGRVFHLNADALVPRPETELLVDTAIAKLPEGGVMLDMGTGSGAIVLSILAERRDCSGLATDISRNALECARANSQKLDVADRVEFIESDWFATLPKRVFDVVASNPPYIARSRPEETGCSALRFDPEIALFAEDNGLGAYRQICDGINHFLRPGGWLVVETGSRQAEAVTAFFTVAGLKNVSILKDLAGLDRVVVGQRSLQMDDDTA